MQLVPPRRHRDAEDTRGMPRGTKPRGERARGVGQSADQASMRAQMSSGLANIADRSKVLKAVKQTRCFSTQQENRFVNPPEQWNGLTGTPFPEVWRTSPRPASLQVNWCWAVS
eukprot:349929-Chlamydomonas_euryale.AAC.16